MTRETERSKTSYSTLEVVRLSGLPTKHMVDYLCRTGVLRPSMSGERKRGVPRLFSYTDLLLARAVATLLKSGVSVENLKGVLQTLHSKLATSPVRALSKKYVTIVHGRVFLRDTPKSVVELTAGGQLAFHFALDLRAQEQNLAKKPTNSLRARKQTA